MPLSRSQLSEQLRGLPIWTEVKKAYSAAIPDANKNGEYAKCLQDLMSRGVAGKEAYRKCKEQTGIAAKLAAVWGD